MPTVETRYVFDNSEANRQFQELKREIRDVQDAENRSQKDFQTNAQKRAQLLKEEEQDLKELRRRRDQAYNVREIERYNDRIKQTERRVKNLRGEYGGLEKSNKSLVNSFQSVAAAVGVAFGLQEIKQFSIEAANLAGEAEGIRAAFVNIGGNEQFLAKLNEAVRGTVSEMELMQRTVQATNLGVAMEDLPNLFEFATKRAVETGESVDFLVDSIVRGLGRQSTKILDNLGLSLEDMRDAAEEHGDFTAGVMSVIQQELADMGDVAETESTRMARANARMTNSMVEFGNIVAPAVAGIKEGIADLIGFVLANREAFTVLIAALGTYAAAVSLAKLRTLALNTAMLSNPYALVAAGVAGLVAVILNYNEIIGETIDKESVLADVREKAQISIAKEKSELQSLLAIAEDQNQSREAQERAINKINEILPSHIENIDREAVATGKARTAIEEYVDALEEKAFAQALQESLVEVNKEIIRMENNANEGIAPLVNINTLWNRIKNGTDLAGAALDNLDNGYLGLIKRRKTLLELIKETNQEDTKAIEELKQEILELNPELDLTGKSMEELQQIFARLTGESVQLADGVQKIIDNLNQQTRELTMGTEALLVWKLTKEGATQATIDSAVAIFRENQAIEDQMELRQKQLEQQAERAKQAQEQREKRREQERENERSFNEAVTQAEEEKITRFGELAQQEIDQRQQVEEAIDTAAEKAKQSLADGLENFQFYASAASQLVTVIRDVYKATTKDAEENAQFLQALAIFQIILDQAQAIAAAVRVGASSSFEVVSLVVNIATAVGTVIAQTAAVLSQAKSAQMPSRPTFGQGGWIDGFPHSQGGTGIEAEKGEYIVKRIQAAKYKEALESINDGRFDEYVVKNYLPPLMAAKSGTDRNKSDGFAGNVAKALSMEMKGDNDEMIFYLKRLIKNSRSTNIENIEDMARALKKDSRGPRY